MQAVVDGSPPSENSELDRRTAPAGAEGTADAHETALIRSARAGDHLAYAELVRAHERLAFRTAYVIAGPDDAEEAAQNAFIKAHGALNRFTPGRPFRPWLLKIVVNEARTVRRAAYRHRAVGGRVADAFDANAATASAAAEAAQTETDKTLREAIARLPARHRDVVICRYLLELSELETAQTLDLRPGTVKSRLSRALDRLRSELAQVERGEYAYIERFEAARSGLGQVISTCPPSFLETQSPLERNARRPRSVSMQSSTPEGVVRCL